MGGCHNVALNAIDFPGVQSKQTTTSEVSARKERKKGPSFNGSWRGLHLSWAQLCCTTDFSRRTTGRARAPFTLIPFSRQERHMRGPASLHFHLPGRALSVLMALPLAERKLMAVCVFVKLLWPRYGALEKDKDMAMAMGAGTGEPAACPLPF